MGNPGLDRKLRSAASKGNLAAIEQLLAAGADIEGQGGFFTLGMTPLGCAAWDGKVEAARLLLEKGANPEAQDTGGDTPLWIAISRGHTDIAALLLAHGADPRTPSRTNGRYTPVELARYYKNQPLLEMLEKAVAEREEKERLAREIAGREQLERKKAAKEAERSKDKNLIIFHEPLGDRTLEEVYNFASLERITLVRQGEEGPVEAITRQDFADIGDKPCLRRAFAEHVRRGGTVAERAVFPDGPLKLKSLPGNAP